MKQLTKTEISAMLHMHDAFESYVKELYECDGKYIPNKYKELFNELLNIAAFKSGLIIRKIMTINCEIGDTVDET